MASTFEDLVADADSASVDGWDFSWLAGRATEQRPSWGYQRLLSERLVAASAALDIQTGGGEVLAGVAKFPPTMAPRNPGGRMSPRPPSLHPRGVVVVADPDEPPLPFADAAFDLVTRPPPRHRMVDRDRPRPQARWDVLRAARRTGHRVRVGGVLPRAPGRGTQEASSRRRERRGSGQVVDLRLARLGMEFFDIGAVVYFLRKVIWTVPGFTIDRYRDRLRELHEQIEADGPFVASSSRLLLEAHKPA